MGSNQKIWPKSSFSGQLTNLLFFWSLFALAEETVFWTEEVENEILRWNDEKNKLAEVSFLE